MLEMRPDCERCGRELPPDSSAAFICSLECTFCAECAGNELNYICLNCGGELLRRPSRRAELLARFPAAAKKRVSHGGRS